VALEVAVAVELLLHDFEELAQVLPAHSFALIMEVKPCVRHIIIFQRFINITELIAESFLRTFLVD
jgi:hypothetical protein